MPKTEPPGSTTHIVAGELLRRRTAAGWSQKHAASLFTAAGYPVKIAAYAAIETGKTRITVDMLTVAATVFRCSPTALMLPMSKPQEPVTYQGLGQTTTRNARAWLAMETPVLSA